MKEILELPDHLRRDLSSRYFTLKSSPAVAQEVAAVVKEAKRLLTGRVFRMTNGEWFIHAPLGEADVTLYLYKGDMAHRGVDIDTLEESVTIDCRIGEIQLEQIKHLLAESTWVPYAALEASRG